MCLSSGVLFIVFLSALQRLYLIYTIAHPILAEAPACKQEIFQFTRWSHGPVQLFSETVKYQRNNFASECASVEYLIFSLDALHLIFNLAKVTNEWPPKCQSTVVMRISHLHATLYLLSS